MSDADRIAELEAQLEAARRTVDEQKDELERARQSDAELRQRLNDANVELEATLLRAEVERLSTSKKVRGEERERSQVWADDLRERFKAEKRVLEERIAALEAKSTSEASTPTTSASAGDTPTSGSSATISTTTPSTRVSTVSSETSVGASSSITTTAALPASTTTSGSSTTVTHSTPTLTSVGSAEMIARLFETQSQLLAAQVQAASLPPLKCFDGNLEGDDAEFERWMERFEERARLAKWTEETRLCQLKLHLTKLADQVFQMFPKEDQSSYSRAVTALKKRFRSVEIEELKGLEFRRRVQGEESIEQLGMDLQKLGHKAFPAAEGREFDRLLKGRFYQALHPRWQRKLNAPRTDETFTQLFERARMLEHHEKQFTASAACRADTQGKKSRPSGQTGGGKAPSQRAQKPQDSTPAAGTTPKFTRTCYVCHEAGHLARNCPTHRNPTLESPGRSANEPATRTSAIEAHGTDAQPELTEEELEFLLARCRLQKEQQLLLTTQGGKVACVEASTSQPSPPVVGPLFYSELEVGGVAVMAMVDCGSQTTIISLHFCIELLSGGSKRASLLPS